MNDTFIICSTVIVVVLLALTYYYVFKLYVESGGAAFDKTKARLDAQELEREAQLRLEKK